MTGAIVEFDALRKIRRLGERAKRATVARWAPRANICHRYDGRGGIWTTLDAISAALIRALPDALHQPMYAVSTQGPSGLHPESGWR